MVLRARAPKRSAMSSCAGPKTRRKSLARNLPSLLAANAVIVFTGQLPAGKMLSFWGETGRRKTPAGTLAHLELGPLVWPAAARVGPDWTSVLTCKLRQQGIATPLLPSPVFRTPPR